MLRDKITREPSIVKQTICKRIWRPRQEQRTSTTRHYNACVDISSTQKKKKKKKKKKEEKKKKKKRFQNSIPHNWITDHKARGSAIDTYTFEFRPRGGKEAATEVRIAWLIRSRVSRLVKPPGLAVLTCRNHATGSKDLARSASLVVCRPRSTQPALARNGLVPRRLGTRLSRTRRQSPLPAEESASQRERGGRPRRGQRVLHTRWMSAAKANGATVSGRLFGLLC